MEQKKNLKDEDNFEKLVNQIKPYFSRVFTSEDLMEISVLAIEKGREENDNTIIITLTDCDDKVTLFNILDDKKEFIFSLKRIHLLKKEFTKLSDFMDAEIERLGINI